MFTIQIEGVGGTEAERVGQELAERINDCVEHDFISSACSNYAQLKTAEVAIRLALSQCSDPLRARLQESHEVGKDFMEDGMRFCIVDKPDYNFSDPRNDTEGLYRAKVAEIEQLADKQKLLTVERRGIEAGILNAHPNMIPAHHYSLVYKPQK